MPICPKCKSEYVEGIRVCRDCGVELVEDELECDECGAVVGQDDSYCSNCGSLSDHHIKCAEHPDVEAESLCLLCMKPLCSECVVKVSGRSFCLLHSGCGFTEDNWTVIYLTNDMTDAQTARDYLADMEIPCVIDSRKGTARVLSVDQLSEIWLLVPLKYALIANHYLSELKMLEEEKTERECERCGQRVKGDDVYCSNCGMVFDSDLRCARHPEARAVSVCVVCNTSLCDECAVYVSGKPYCPLCIQKETEQREGGEESVAEEETVLQEEEARSEVSQDEEEYECERCGHMVTLDDTFCTICGDLFDDTTKCTEHPDVTAVSACLICKKPLCSECVVRKAGKTFCTEHSNYHLIGNYWAVVYSTGEGSYMDRRKDFLIRNNIPCIVDSEQLDKKGPFGRPVTAFRLAVPLDYVMEAESLLEE